MTTDLATAAIPVDPPALLVRCLDERRSRYMKQLRRCSKSCDEKKVHDLRVATRRLMTCLDSIMLVHTDRRLKETRRVLKKNLSLFGPLRDVQVQILAVTGLLPRYPQLETFLTVLLLREKIVLRRIAKHLAQNAPRMEARSFTTLKKDLREKFSGKKMQEAMMEALKGWVALTFAKAADLLASVDASNTETIHCLRLSFKKFRYNIEMFHPLLGGLSEGQPKAMDSYQVRMGEIQDIEVLMASIDRFVLQRRRARPAVFLPVRKELALKRKVLIDTFMESREELLTFWRDASRTTSATSVQP